MCTIRRAAAVLLAISALALPAASQVRADDNFDAVTGYRIKRYQAATPDQPPAGKRVWIDEIDRLIRERSAILLDVAPIVGAGYDPQTGVWRMNAPHETLPGAVWLAEVGRGVIDPVVARYLHVRLDELTGGDMTRAVVVFCHADCWMAWNAVKRIAALGYTSLYWFPEGTDGWRDWDRALTPARPLDIPPDALRATPAAPAGPIK